MAYRPPPHVAFVTSRLLAAVRPDPSIRVAVVPWARRVNAPLSFYAAGGRWTVSVHRRAQEGSCARRVHGDVHRPPAGRARPRVRRGPMPPASAPHSRRPAWTRRAGRPAAAGGARGRAVLVRRVRHRLRHGRRTTAAARRACSITRHVACRPTRDARSQRRHGTLPHANAAVDHTREQPPLLSTASTRRRACASARATACARDGGAAATRQRVRIVERTPPRRGRRPPARGGGGGAGSSGLHRGAHHLPSCARRVRTGRPASPPPPRAGGRRPRHVGFCRIRHAPADSESRTRRGDATTDGARARLASQFARVRRGAYVMRQEDEPCAR